MISLPEMVFIQKPSAKAHKRTARLFIPAPEVVLRSEFHAL